jgi:hypothetical protein
MTQHYLSDAVAEIALNNTMHAREELSRDFCIDLELLSDNAIIRSTRSWRRWRRWSRCRWCALTVRCVASMLAPACRRLPVRAVLVCKH